MGMARVLPDRSRLRLNKLRIKVYCTNVQNITLNISDNSFSSQSSYPSLPSLWKVFVWVYDKDVTWYCWYWYWYWYWDWGWGWDWLIGPRLTIQINVEYFILWFQVWFQHMLSSHSPLLRYFLQMQLELINRRRN